MLRTSPIILIDGDIIAYRMACAIGNTQGDGLDLYEGVCDEIARWNPPDCSESDIIICLSEGQSFRYGIYPEYKHNRADKPDPPLRADAVQILREYFYCASSPGLEGDDVMGILAGTLRDDAFILVTIDKDLKQVPGYHWNPDKGGEPVFIDEYEGLYNLHLQWLTGDATDGYPGVPGIGPKKAAKMLSSFWFDDEVQGVAWYDFKAATACIYEFYKQRQLSDTYCAQMLQCAKILQSPRPEDQIRVV